VLRPYYLPTCRLYVIATLPPTTYGRVLRLVVNRVTTIPAYACFPRVQWCWFRTLLIAIPLRDWTLPYHLLTLDGSDQLDHGSWLLYHAADNGRLRLDTPGSGYTTLDLLFFASSLDHGWNVLFWADATGCRSTYQVVLNQAAERPLSAYVY